MPEYMLGHADPEIERLQIQARCLEGVSAPLVGAWTIRS
jgi:hypothetical protein